uniref:Uncharacterized protein n=1 Tax=Peronospora matthiolae TaxID=2874970 RepID=A0AAV1T5Q5_9STRA
MLTAVQKHLRAIDTRLPKAGPKEEATQEVEVVGLTHKRITGTTT